MPSLQPPLHLMTASEEIGQVVRDWSRRSLGARPVGSDDLPSGTLLLRTGGDWDCVVAAAVYSERTLHPVIVLKNPVALWQCSRKPLPDGRVDRGTWTWLRRQIMIHNPGLDGLLQELEDRVVAADRATWVTTTHDWARDVDTAHLAEVRRRRQELVGGPAHLLLEVLAYADDEAQARGDRGRAEVTLGPGWVSVRDDGRGTDTRVDESGAPIRKPVMATRDVRFFDADPPVLLPDGLPRRGMSVVAALSGSLTHVNRRRGGSWAQTYRHGVPEAELVPIESDGTTGTTVHFRLDATVDLEDLVERARGFAFIDVRVARSTSRDPAG